MPCRPASRSSVSAIPGRSRAARRAAACGLPGRRLPPCMVVRGGFHRQFTVGLFQSAAGGELDRIAFAVDGVESRHGRDPLMWRPEPDGPQGPMQVSLKAALDVGGGGRFGLRETLLLSRAAL